CLTFLPTEFFELKRKHRNFGKHYITQKSQRTVQKHRTGYHFGKVKTVVQINFQQADNKYSSRRRCQTYESLCLAFVHIEFCQTQSRKSHKQKRRKSV